MQYSIQVFECRTIPAVAGKSQRPKQHFSSQLLIDVCGLLGGSREADGKATACPAGINCGSVSGEPLCPHIRRKAGRRLDEGQRPIGHDLPNAYRAIAGPERI